MLINEMHKGLPLDEDSEGEREENQGLSFIERQYPDSFAARQAALNRMRGRLIDPDEQARVALDRVRERLAHPRHPLFTLENLSPRLVEPLETVERFPPGPPMRPPMRRLTMPDELPVRPSGLFTTTTLTNTNVDLARMLQSIGVSSDDFAQALWDHESAVLGRESDDDEDDETVEGSSEEDIFAPVESLRDPHALDDIFDPPTAEEQQQRQLARTNARIQEELREAQEALRVASQMIAHNEQEVIGYQRALMLLGIFWLFVLGLSVCSFCLSLAAL